MGEYERKIMRKGEKITLLTDFDENNQRHKRTFRIIARDGVGSSSVGYRASSGRKTGFLKEFNPASYNFGDYFNFTRRKDNQLIRNNISPEADELYEYMLNEYIEAYYMLDETKREAERGNNSFNTFLPSFEILRGCNQKGEVVGSAYIWTIDNDGDFEIFEDFLNKVHKHPARNPAKDLFTILMTLYNLTESLKVLHNSGIIHGDLSPANFGLPIRGARYLTEQVKLFDINSIYSPHTEWPAIKSTAEFCAPEVIRGNHSPTTQSDLYSIGAILFYAIALFYNAEDECYISEYYTKEYYNKIDWFVAESELLNASPITSSYRFQHAISSILNKCLAASTKARVDSCDELKNDIKNAAALLIPSQYNEDLKSDCKIEVIDEALDNYNESDATFALQSLLFNHPIYENAGDKIKVLVLGCGVYGQLFLDLCLQLGQMTDKELEVCVLTQDKELYKKEYLEKRPALTDFFEIDGVGDTGKSSYGKITFISPREISHKAEFAMGFKTGTEDAVRQYNESFAEELISDNYKYNYVFVSLGDDILNGLVAAACHKAVLKSDCNATVSYVSSGFEKIDGCHPVNVASKAEQSENFETIQRMAFNAHWSWFSPLKLNVNEKKVYQTFKVKYDHDSSVSCILHIRYKLHSFGIELNELTDEDLARAADKYDKVIKSNDEAYAALVNVEHGRWMVEKLTRGWTCRTDYEECLLESINNKKKKLHPCIVKSNPDFNLEKYYKDETSGKWIKSKWNLPCPEDSLLDDLDRVSLNLHRTFYKHAQEIKNSFSLKGEEYMRIRSIISRENKSVVAFNEYMFCLQRIWDCDEKQTKFYDGYKDAFLETIKVLPKSEQRDVLKYVDIINTKATPLLRAYSLRDYKSSDKALIEAIPFILTHRWDYNLFIAMIIGDTAEKFNNVAVPTLINPAVITYAVYLKKYEDIKETEDTLSDIISYMQKKEIKSKLNLMLICCENNKRVSSGLDELKYRIHKLDKARIKKVDKLFISDESQIDDVITANVSADAYERNSSYLSALLTKSGFYNSRPSYSFDSSNKEFSVSDGCKWLQYIKGEQFLTVSDMLSFKNSEGKIKSFPEHYDFNTLWGIYAHRGFNWNDMCIILKNYSETNDLLASFDLATDLSNAQTFEFIIPNELREGYNYAISKLRDELKVLGETSRIEYVTAESCCVIAEVGTNNISSIEDLLSEPQKFINKNDISIVPKQEKVEIYYDSLTVRSLKIEDNNELSYRKKNFADILQALRDSRYIFNLKNTDNKEFSFVYSTKYIKRLMTDRDRILEVYTYHKLHEADFDDVVSKYVISKDPSDTKSVFDCIVTSGFRSAVIECISEDKLSQDIYDKLARLAKRFAINSVPVLIADTNETFAKINRFNELQREYGNKMGVYTIFDREEIKNIDVTLRRILDGNY